MLNAVYCLFVSMWDWTATHLQSLDVLQGWVNISAISVPMFHHFIHIIVSLFPRFAVSSFRANIRFRQQTRVSIESGFLLIHWTGGGLRSPVEQWTPMDARLDWKYNAKEKVLVVTAFRTNLQPVVVVKEEQRAGRGNQVVGGRGLSVIAHREWTRPHPWGR